MAQSLAHRGPDQWGVYRGAGVALGAVRLAIIDLSAGDQPISSEDGGVTIVFNGEIYNHAELRDELHKRGHKFRTRCDTEVVLHAFREWDTDCFEKLRGMFAVALWCEAGARLVLARDRMGIKPLYLARRGRDLYFASELKAIFEHPEIERMLDWRGLADYLSLNYVPGPHTLAAGIEKLPPGHWLEWRHGRLRMQAYWRLTLTPRRAASLEEAKEQLDSLLRDSVREHLIADVPLGVWASGGLDSSTILHYAAERAPRLKTFSVSFLGRSFDESRYFREVARRYGAEHHEFDLNPSVDLASAIEQIAYYCDEPSADAGALPVWFLSKMTRRHVTVALSGEGADELFGGYYTYLADRYARALRLIPASWRRFALRLLARWPASDEKIGLEYKVKRFVQGSLLEPVSAHLFWNGTFCEKEKAKLCRYAIGRPFYELLPRHAQAAGALNQFLWLDQLCYLPDDILIKCDRMSMAHSLEVRPPFLDHRIVEFAAHIPEKFKIQGSRLKVVLRELMRDKLPEAVLKRRKEGFDIPAHQWFRGPLRALLLDTLTERAVRDTGVFSWEQVRRILDDHLRRRANYGYHLWGLLILFLWMRKWKIRTATVAQESVAICRP